MCGRPGCWPRGVTGRGTLVVHLRHNVRGPRATDAGGPTLPANHAHAAADRLRSLLLQAFLVGLVVTAGLLVFETVADATTEAEEQMHQAER